MQIKRQIAANLPMLTGDYFVILLSILVVIFMFKQFWSSIPANQTRNLTIKGAIGTSHISILQGKVRFTQSPCPNQYCVHQGWLSRAGQVAICLPNQISLQLLGNKAPYDSLNY
jgi:hypothetical protein